MAKTFPCTFGNCDRAFTKAYELRKHKATHEKPESVHHCSECDFITLQKSSLVIHLGKHTGEKAHACPDMVSVYSLGSPAREERCEYRTNDPAALSKHRQRAHGYIPPSHRSRVTKAGTTPSPRKPRQRKENISPTRRPASPRKTRSPRKANHASNSGNHPFVSGPSADGDAMEIDYYEESDDEMTLDTFYDASLRSQWMAKYEEGYSSFDVTGMKHLPEPLREVSATVPAGVPTGREGCLCPDWMVEAGVEGWDQSAFETHKEYYVLDD